MLQNFHGNDLRFIHKMNQHQEYIYDIINISTKFILSTFF